MQAAILYIARITALFQKEILAILKDPSSRALLIAPALMQALLFGYGATYDLTNAPYAVLDQSRSDASTEIIARLEGTGVFHRVAVLDNTSQIAAQIESGDALLVLQFQPDFASRLARGDKAEVQVLLDGRNSATAGVAAAYVSSIVAGYGAEQGGANPLGVVRRAWFNPNLESRWNLMPALIASLSMLQTLMLAALSVAREREQGTFDQLLVTPLTPAQILIGKALPSIFVGLLQSTIIFLIIRYWFQVPMNGQVWLMYLGLIVFTTAAIGLGLSISAVALNMQQAMLYCVHSDHAADAAVRVADTGAQHAGNPAMADLCEPAALRHRPCAAGLSGRGGVSRYILRLRPAIGGRSRDLAAGGLAVSQSVGVRGGKEQIGPAWRRRGRPRHIWIVRVNSGVTDVD